MLTLSILFQGSETHVLMLTLSILFQGSETHVVMLTLSILFQGSETHVFSCKRWLARDEEDGAIERELVPDRVFEEVVKKDGSVRKKEKRRESSLECE